jgi:hypothetical protein
MKLTRTFVFAAGATLTLAAPASADFVVQLRSGTMLRATRYWTQGDTVQLEQRGGRIGLPRTAIESIVEEQSPPPPAPRTDDAASKDAAASSRTAGATVRAAARPSSPAAESTAHDAAAASADTSTTLDVSLDAELAERKDEDLTTRSARLDKLLLETHRDLSTARFEHKSDEELERLQRRVDTINGRRRDAMQRLGAIR